MPWPDWVVLCDSCFNFVSPISEEQRKHSFEKLLDKKFGPVPLKDDEKARLKAEYVTVFVNVSTLIQNTELKTPESIWYELLTQEKYYKTCTNMNEFALRFLTRTFNVCTVESQAINSIETSLRHLKNKMTEMLSFISTNGPHPLASLHVIEDALNVHFKGKPWHFVRLVIQNITHQK